MAEQPVPDVTGEDVTRIALRDFGEQQVALVLSILDEYGKQTWNNPSARVRLAILKLANGDLDRLLDHTQVAIQDYRDVLAYAEYPRYMREVGFDDPPEDVKNTVIEEDWQQYCEWLQRRPA